MEKLKLIFELRDMLRHMELDIGLDDLSRAERDILMVAHMLSAEPGDSIASDEIRSHNLVKSIAQATYHRALRTLLDQGFLETAVGSKTKRYVLRRDLMSN